MTLRNYESRKRLKKDLCSLSMEDLIELEDYYVKISGDKPLVFADGVPFYRFYKEDKNGYAFSIWLGITEEDHNDNVFTDFCQYVEKLKTNNGIV